MLNEAVLPKSGPTQILLVGGTERDKEYFRLLFPGPGWLVQSARSVRQAGRLLASLPIKVVLTERILQDGTWSDVLDIAAAGPWPPPVIVGSHDADERMWAEVLSLGGYDVLLKPFEPTEAKRVVELAVRRRFVPGVQIAVQARAAS